MLFVRNSLRYSSACQNLIISPMSLADLTQFAALSEVQVYAVVYPLAHRVLMALPILRDSLSGR